MRIHRGELHSERYARAHRASVLMDECAKRIELINQGVSVRTNAQMAFALVNQVEEYSKDLKMKMIDTWIEQVRASLRRIT